VMEQRGVEFKHKVSWDNFYKYYEHEKLCIKGMRKSERRYVLYLF
jgi:hypothetical protein